MLITIVGKCQWQDCEEDATHMARNESLQKVALYCYEHAREAAGWYIAEYMVECPNCHCMLGVG